MDTFNRINGNMNLLEIHEILVKEKQFNFIIFGEATSILYNEKLFIFGEERQQIKDKVWLTSQESCKLSEQFGISLFN